MTVTVRQAADRLEVSQSTVYGLIAAGKLRCARIGLGRGVIRIQEEHLAEYLAGTQAAPRSSSVPSRVPHGLKHLKLS
jgi:excisionase family DNA binding protein